MSSVVRHSMAGMKSGFDITKHGSRIKPRKMKAEQEKITSSDDTCLAGHIEVERKQKRTPKKPSVLELGYPTINDILIYIYE